VGRAVETTGALVGVPAATGCCVGGAVGNFEGRCVNVCVGVPVVGARVG